MRAVRPVLHLVPRRDQVQGYVATLTDGTARVYAHAIQEYLDQHGTLSLAGMVAHRAWLTELQSDQRLAAATVALRLNALRGFAKYLRRSGVLVISDEQIAHDVRLPRIGEQGQYAVLAPDEIARLLAAAAPGRDQLAIGLLLATGMRVSELVAVRLKNIEAPWLHIIYGKGGKNRTVPLRPAVLGHIQRYVAETGRSWQSPRDLQSKLLQKAAGGGLTDARIRQVVKAAAADAGLTKAVTPHALRHTYAVLKLRAGMPLNLVQHVLGHVSLTTTTRYLKHIALDGSCAGRR